MTNHDAVVAVFGDHRSADVAIRKLIDDGFDMKKFSVVGKGYHTEETAIGFFKIGDRMKLWGKYGAFWGGIWGLFFSGVFVAIPVMGPVVVLGHLAAVVVAMVEGAVVMGGLTAIGAAIVSLGIPKDSVIKYETAVKSNGFLVMGRGTSEEISKAKALLGTLHPSVLDVHENLTQVSSAGHTGHAVSAGG